ncbi:hypothetical protein COT49_00170 [candidate division WWE3 bacterium CG08_land_8_20_14_0_20_40_13]|uniref:Uncharacterized protein n=1 Tax=candidate division WWE3 bacterium CG08_land_8_20_14_0_20_40_13 TaxID=1975084 RepID=A0A2H0XES7_UNCKA|nr:MAG: hypothetical protein COT49_00170 [candidate division WWE3 bacterium CG08_land_8_20_14_0_20_40_13]
MPLELEARSISQLKLLGVLKFLNKRFCKGSCSVFNIFDKFHHKERVLLVELMDKYVHYVSRDFGAKMLLCPKVFMGGYIAPPLTL